MSWAAGIWAGLGFESGGEVIFGIGKHTGALISIDDFVASPITTRWCAFQQEFATFGLGAGGSGGFNLVVGYNAATPSDFDGASVGFDFSIDLVLGRLDSYFRSLPEMIELAAIAKKFDPKMLSVAKGLTKYENAKIIKPVVENLVKNYSGVAYALKGEPTLLSFGIPSLSGGLRLSLKCKAESTTVLSFGAEDTRS